MAKYVDYYLVYAVNLGLKAFLLLPISVMMCASFWLARSYKDPARTAFTYLKIIIALAFLYV